MEFSFYCQRLNWSRSHRKLDLRPFLVAVAVIKFNAFPTSVILVYVLLLSNYHLILEMHSDQPYKK